MKLKITILALAFLFFYCWLSYQKITLIEIDQTLTECETRIEKLEQKETVAVVTYAEETKLEYLGKFKITAYNASIECCGKDDGITASGAIAKEGITVASDWDKLPKGTVIYIDGIGERVVEDKGGMIKGNKLDLFFEDFDTCFKFGVQELEVWKVNADKEANE